MMSDALVSLLDGRGLSIDKVNRLREISLNLYANQQQQDDAALIQIQAGKLWNEIKRILPGDWVWWYTQMYRLRMVKYSLPQAENFMSVANRFDGQHERLKGLNKSAIPLLAAAQTPNSTVERILDEVAAGRKFKNREISAIIAADIATLHNTAVSLITATAASPVIDARHIGAVVQVVEQIARTGAVDGLDGENERIQVAVTAQEHETMLRQREALANAGRKQAGVSSFTPRVTLCHEEPTTILWQGAANSIKLIPYVRIPDWLADLLREGRDRLVGPVTITLSLYQEDNLADLRAAHPKPDHRPDSTQGEHA